VCEAVTKIDSYQVPSGKDLSRMRFIPLLSCLFLLALPLSDDARAQIGPMERPVTADPPRFILQAGASFCMPIGDLGATDLYRGGYATRRFGLSFRLHAAVTRGFALYAGLLRPRFGYDTAMLEEDGIFIENPVQGFNAGTIGARVVISEMDEALTYLQGGVGSYRFESQATFAGDPLVEGFDPVLGYSVGIGVMNRHSSGPGFDVTFTAHFTDVTSPTPSTGKMKARWLSLTFMVGFAAGEVK
jgi:hypothetical protein